MDASTVLRGEHLQVPESLEVALCTNKWLVVLSMPRSMTTLTPPRGESYPISCMDKTSQINLRKLYGTRFVLKGTLVFAISILQHSTLLRARNN